MKRISRLCRRAPSEFGQSLALVGLLLPVLLGGIGLSVDFGRLAAEQRKLQNYADSAALSGAQDLSLYYTQACTDAATTLTNNNNPATTSCAISRTNGDHDTITVTLTEAMPLDFFPILGLNTKTLTANGVAVTSSVTGCKNTSTSICAPYAGWRPTATSGCPDQFQAGMTIVIRANSWSDANLSGASSCATWDVNSNDFKGFLRPTGSQITTGTNTITTKGGNACGQEPVSDIQSAYSAHQNLIIPVLDSGTENGNSTVHIPGFITISLNFRYQYVNQVQSVTLNGSPTSGSFQLTYNGKTTAAIAYNASADTVENALENLSTIGDDNVSVSGGSGGPYVITLGGSMTMTTLQAITLAAGSTLAGGSTPAVSIAQTETNSSKANTFTQVSDYSCPATWYAKVVSTSTSAGSTSGIQSGQACNSTFYSCQIRLNP